jgi:hypothetical protein
MSIRGQQSAANGYIVFGNTDSTSKLGRAGSGPLTYAGAFSATGNVTGNYILGNGAFLSGVITSVANINNGTSNVTVVSSGGNITVGVGGTGNVAVFATTGEYITGLLSVSGNITGGNISTSGSGGNITGANVISATTLSATANITGGNIIASANISVTGTGGAISGTGNITAGNIITGGVIAGNNNIVINAPGVGEGGQLVLAWGNTANIYGQANRSWNIDVDGSNNFRIFYQDATAGTGVPITITQTSNLVTMVGPLSVNSGSNATAIINGAANAVGNIGSSSTYFNRLFAQATTALYADLAEMYVADAEYDPGTVLELGGSKEVTISLNDSSPCVVGVVSTNPAHLMNSGLTAQHTVAVALVGRVPCKVIGPISKGNMIVSAGNGYGRAETSPAVGTVIGKAVENHPDGPGVIEILIGKM